MRKDSFREIIMPSNGDCAQPLPLSLSLALTLPLSLALESSPCP
jgi:hypothetical protein